MMPLNYLLSFFQFTKSGENINHLIYMDNINLFEKKKPEIIMQIIRIYSQYIDWNLG